MTLHLDDRQRAMLAEMGIRLVEAIPGGRPDSAPSSPPHQAGGSAVASPVAASVEACAALADEAPRAPVTRASPPAPAAPVVLHPAGDRPGGVDAMDWEALEAAVAGCQACGLCQSRRNTVFGVGDRQAEWLVVGEAPGENEDLQGEPFVGAAGKLLDNMLRSIGLDRQHKVYIANVLKCRPPGNRNPEPAEVAQCEPFLRRQVALLQPKIIVAMGRFAVQSLLGSTEPLGKLRGRVHEYQGVPVVVTYHPAYLLRNLPEKAKAWADLCLALDRLEPPRG
ncbi:uracil-DNA glycosylase [Ramlibacter sp. MAHUQ-53]|uniref:uracil-DNA glycosylase n=1 Tax=unclassified Ramlibacter TaxID=2617605 RepID=UPI003642140F